MKFLVKESQSLDKRAIALGLDAEILMENAGLNLAQCIKKALKKLGKKKAKLLFVLGGGKNGADCLVAARNFKNAFLYECNHSLKINALYTKQRQIALNLHLAFLQEKPDFNAFDCIVDGVFGSGFRGELSKDLKELFKQINQSKALKIACDMPSALNDKIGFKADISLAMGAIKENMLEDRAKERVGRIKIAKLGLSSQNFLPATLAHSFLLEKKDLRLIQRKAHSHKGDFGHVFIVASKSAGSLASLGALNFGAGLVSLVAKEAFSPLIMLKTKLEDSASVIALGMGLEDLSVLDNPLLETKPLVLDAACFSSAKILQFLNRKDVVITPHPKEFTRLWSLAFKEELSIEKLQNERFFYARAFAKAFDCVLLLKGANPIIICKDKLFVIRLGNANLAKGGSGDVLSGMIAALLASGFSALEAAKNAALAHALASKTYKFNANSFDALKLIKALQCL